MIYPNWLAQRAYITGNQLALSYGEKSWTFSEVDEVSHCYAEKLASYGVSKSSRVALLSKSQPEAVFIMYACMQIGCEMVLLNERLAGAELLYQIEDAEVEYVFSQALLMDKVAAARPVSFEELRGAERTQVLLKDEWPGDGTISIMYTSGTTGNPKGVRQTAENHFSSAVSSALNLGVSPDDVWLCTVPLFHISGFSILMRSLVYGMGVRLYDKFDAKTCAEELCSGRVTHSSMVGVMLEQVLREIEENKLEPSPRFKQILAGGGPVPVASIERSEALGIQVLQTYGMTETSSQTTTLQAADAKRKIGSAGKPLFLYQVKIGDDKQANEQGEIFIKGPHVSPGYIGSFEGQPLAADGWLPTGDIGFLDAEGYLFVVDRRSDLIVSGGENVYPAEIEKALMAHPAVQEAGVCGMPDARWGEVPAAFVVLNDPQAAGQLAGFCREQLAGYKVPKQFHVVDALPRSASNKLLRRELKKWL